MNKKKVWMGAVTAALALTVLTTGALAGWHHGWSGGSGNYGAWANTVCHYADADGDGVCDNRGTGACHYVDADGDGVCDNYGQYTGTGYGQYAGTGHGGGHHGGGCRGGGCHR